MDTVLGLLGMLVWIAGTIVLAAAVTWAVVKVTPGGRDTPSGEAPPTPQ